MNDTTEIISDLTMFTCTLRLRLSNINCTSESLSKVLKLTGCVKAINSNFYHIAQPEYLKCKKDPNQNRKCKRKFQGDGTCFNSAIEAIIIPDHTNPKKYYAIKTFPSTGKRKSLE